MLLGQTPQPRDAAPQARKAQSEPKTRRVASERPMSSRWLAIVAALAVLLGGAYGGYEYTRWQPAETGMRDAEAKQLAALIDVRRKEAADAAQRQVELEAERQRQEAADAAQRQAAIEAERRRTEAADTARRQAQLDAERKRREAADAAQRQAAIEAERQRTEAADTARRLAELDVERQRREAADVARRLAELDQERRRKEEAERIAAAEEAARKSAAEAEAKRADEERRRIASRGEAKPNDDEAGRRAETEVRSAVDRKTLTRSLQTALNRVGCFPGEIDGQWGTKGRAALVQFAQSTKLKLATDEPSTAALEAVAARTGRVCPLECEDDKIEVSGKCVQRLSKAKDPEANNKGGTARAKPREERRSAEAPSQRSDVEPSSERKGCRGRGWVCRAIRSGR
jgi:hypothetical protein